MDQIVDRLWIGDIQDAQSGDTSRFDRVVSVCQNHAKSNVSDETTYNHFKLADSTARETAGVYGGRCNYSLFERAATAVFDAVDDGEVVLVHCHAGRDRSAAICMAALSRTMDISYGEAYNIVREARPIANPSKTMEKYAKRYARDNSKGF